MMQEIYFLDTSIFMYARGKGHHYRASCSSLILAIGNGSFEQKYGQAVVDSEVFQEILYRYCLINQWDTAMSLLQDVYALNLNILPVGEAEIMKMMELAIKYKELCVSPRDLVHAAVMLTNNIKDIISADRDFDRIEEIRRIDPITLYNV
ncbi:MAG: type II toxin-antitoxin system VapC family toxin [Actinobacteria bacterium]|nr:type II toxin-antitoxin system VapC family toxin [Actinomycetota bacterium]